MKMNEYRESESKKVEEAERIDIIAAMRSIWQGLGKSWWLILLLSAVFAVQSYFFASYTYQPSYVASATMAVRTRGGNSGYINQQLAKQMEAVFPYIMESGVLKDVIAEDMGLDSVPGVIQAHGEEGTNLFTFSVSAGDPQIAYDTLQSVIKNYPKVARFVIGDIQFEILDETGVPEDAGKEVSIRGSYVKGALKGAAIGIGIMAVYILTRKTVKTSKKLKSQLNLEYFGSVPFVFEKKRKKKKTNVFLNLLNERISQGYLEAIRKLRIKVMKEMSMNGYQTLLVTSSVPKEGKSTLAANLAIAIAKQGKKVILVDCDTRHPSIAGIMNEKGKHPGIGKVIRGEAPISQALTAVPVEGGTLSVLYGGEASNKDSNILGTNTMKEFLNVIKKYADIVILDTAPSELFADASALAKFVDAALYVVKYDHAQMRQIRSGIRALSMSGIDILGYVFNGDKTKSRQSYGYGYSYKRYGSYGSYGHYGKYSNNKKHPDTSGRVIKD